MPTIRIPTPLRPYTGTAAEVTVEGDTVGAALKDLAVKHPDLRKHLYNDSGELRAFVNIFLAQEDVRHLQGEQTPVKPGDQLRIVPSVAGGQDQVSPNTKVDHNALRVNQAFIIGLLILAYLFNSVWLAAFVALVLVIGSAIRRPGFKPAYDLLRRFNLIKPDVVADNPEPHLFSQGLGAAFVSGGALSLWVGAAGLGWGLCWLVVGLAALNLFGGFCAGCFVYYWLNRVNVPGFVKTAPPHTFPGMRPRGHG